MSTKERSKSVTPGTMRLTDEEGPERARRDGVSTTLQALALCGTPGTPESSSSDYNIPPCTATGLATRPTDRPQQLGKPHSSPRTSHNINSRYRGVFPSEIYTDQGVQLIRFVAFPTLPPHTASAQDLSSSVRPPCFSVPKEPLFH